MVPIVAAGAAHTRGRVLIIEDDEAMRLLETTTLRHAGWVVAGAATGQQGVEAAIETLPDVIICDRVLPDLDGLEVITRLALDPRTASIPIVLVTAMSGTDDVVRGMEAGAHDYLAKPFRLIELEVRCRAALRVSREHQTLALSEARYRALLDHLTDTVAIVYDRDLRVVVAAGAGLRPRGLDGPDLVGRPFTELAGTEDTTFLEATYRAAFEGESTTVEFISGTGDEDLLDVVPVLTAHGGDPIEILVVARNIGPLKDRERARSAAEERWRVAFERAPVGMAQVAVDGRFVRVNPALCDLLGYTADELHERTSVEIGHPDDADEARRELAGGTRSDLPRVRDEKRYLHADGEVVWCAVSSVPVHDADGTVDHLLVHYLDISELKRVEAELQHLSVHDSLTGLLNRRGFAGALDVHVANVARYGSDGALLMLDLDGLKRINDSEGHEAGDRAIATVAEILRHRLRKTDTIARLGGDEFAVILPRASREEAGRIAAAIVETIRDHRPSGGMGRSVTASVGVAMFDAPGRSAERMLADADASMYAAKETGRDRHVMFPEPDLTTDELGDDPAPTAALLG